MHFMIASRRAKRSRCMFADQSTAVLKWKESKAVTDQKFETVSELGNKEKFIA